MREECIKGRLWIDIIILMAITMAFSFTSCQDNLTDLSSDPETISLLTSKSAITQNNVISGYHQQGGEWLISLPHNWNQLETRHLLVYAHGYVNSNEPVSLPSDEIDGIPLTDIINNQGWAFATTSYRANGLVVKDAILDIIDLRNIVDNYLTGEQNFLPPHYIYLGGVSEGGIVGALTMEQYPHSFDGALMTCCPIGNFYKQLQYYGNFHVLFNYFFRDELAVLDINMGDPSGVPEATITQWIDGLIQPHVINMLTLNPTKVEELISTARVPVDTTDPKGIGEAILNLLEFNIMRTNDAIERLGGSPFNNVSPRKWYWGSGNDFKLNSEIERIKTDNWANAKAEIDLYYETSGDISDPMVTMHTTGDHISLYRNQIQYQLKIINKGRVSLFTHIPVKRYGHCTFTQDEVIQALTAMVFRVRFKDIEIPLAAHPTPVH